MRRHATRLAITAVALVLGAPASRATEAATGQAIFQGACATCHESGSPRVLSGQPLLFRTQAITGSDPTGAIRLILHGHHPGAEQRGPWMPGFEPVLSDAEIADVLTWLRQAAGEPPWPDLARRVQAVRVASAATETQQ